MSRWVAGGVGALGALALQVLLLGFLFRNDALARAVQVLFYLPAVLVHRWVPLEFNLLRPAGAERGWREGLHEALPVLNALFYMALGFALGWWLARGHGQRRLG